MKFEVYTVQENGKGEYAPKKGDIRVRFPEYNEDYCTDKDENGELYFPVPNILNNPTTVENRLFVGRIKDAFDTIKNGDGDAIQTSNLFGMKMISVIKFVNYDYGNEMRKKFLEGWKDVEFGWSVEAGYSNSFGGFNNICENMHTYNPYLSAEENSKPFFFTNEEDARNLVKDIEDVSSVYIERLSKATSEEEQSAILDEVENKYGFYSVYMQNVLAKYEGNERGYKFRIVQRVR